MAADASSTAPVVPASPPGRHRGLRWAAATVLLVVAAILVPATLAARFARGEVLNTDRYVATVAPLAHEPAVQNALTDRITTEILSRIDVSALIQQATTELNLKAGPAIDSLVSGPITNWLTSFVHQKVQQFVTGATFASLWVTVNRLAHRGVQNILTGRQGGVVAASGDAVVLNIGPLVDAAKKALVAEGFTLASKVPSIDAQFTLFTTSALPKAQRYVRWLDTLANWLPWITLLCFALGVWLAPGRRRGALIGLVLTAVLLALVLIGNQIARHAYANQLAAAGRDVNAGVVVYDSVIRFLLSAIGTALVTVVAIAVWLWLAGPGRVGRGLRQLTGRWFGWTAGALGWTRGRVLGAIDRYHQWIYLILGLAGFLLLLRVPTGTTVAWIAVVALVLTVAEAILGRLPATGGFPAARGATAASGPAVGNGPSGEQTVGRA